MITFAFEHSPPLLMAMSFISLTDLKLFWTHWALSTAMNSEESSTPLLVHLFCHKNTGPTFTKQISKTPFMWTMFWRSRFVLLHITWYDQQIVARSRPIACIRTLQSPAHTENSIWVGLGLWTLWGVEIPEENQIALNFIKAIQSKLLLVTSHNPMMRGGEENMNFFFPFWLWLEISGIKNTLRLSFKYLCYCKNNLRTRYSEANVVCREG